MAPVLDPEKVMFLQERPILDRTHGIFCAFCVRYARYSKMKMREGEKMLGLSAVFGQFIIL